MTLDMRAQIREGLRGKRWSIETLRLSSGVACSRVSLHRKVHGYRRKGRRLRTYQALTIEDAALLLGALGLNVDVSAA